MSCGGLVPLALIVLASVHAIAGTWALPKALVAIQIEQTGHQVLVVRLMQSGCTRHVEQFSIDVDSVRATSAGTEIRIAGETWTISASGELTIHRDGQRLVLKPTEQLQ